MKARVATILGALALMPILAGATNFGVNTSFGPEGGFYHYDRASFNEGVYDAAIDSQGRILLAFLMEDGSNPGTYWPAVMRLKSDGYGDPTFGFLGLWLESTVDATPECVVTIAVDATDRPVVGWTYAFDQLGIPNRDWWVRRLTTAGAVDDGIVVAFDIGISSSGDRLDQMTDLKVLADGRIVAVGGAQYDDVDWDFAVALLTDDGMGGMALDTSFDSDGRRTVSFDLPGSSLYDNAAAVTTDSTGNMVVVGWSNASSTNVVSVCRLDPSNGNLDTSFDSDGKATYAYTPLLDPALPARGVEVALRGTGFVVGAVLTESNTYDRIGALALFVDGSVDLSFGWNGWFVLAPDYPGLPFTVASSTLTGLARDNDRLVFAASIEDPLDPGQGKGIVLLTDLDGTLDAEFSGGYDHYSFEPAGEATSTGFSSVLIPNSYVVGVSSGRAVLVGSMRGVTGGGSRTDTDLLVTQVFTRGMIFTDGFETGDADYWSSVVSNP